MPGFPQPGSIAEALASLDLCSALTVFRELPDLMPCLALVRDGSLYIVVDDRKPCWWSHMLRMLAEDGPELHAALQNGGLVRTG